MQSCIFWHWCIVEETLGDANQVSALRIAQTFTSRAEMKRRQMKNTEMWHMIYGTYYGCFRAPSRVGSAGSVLSFWQEKEKKTLGWLRLSVVPSFSLSPTFPLCLSVSFSFWPLMLCPTPSLPPSIRSSSLSSPLSFIHCLLFTCSPQHFTELSVECCPDCGHMGGFATAVTVIFSPLSLFPFLCVGGLILFSHCVSTCWGNSAESLHRFKMGVFVTGKQDRLLQLRTPE